MGTKNFHSGIIAQINRLTKIKKIEGDNEYDVDQYNDLLDTIHLMLRIPDVYDQVSILSCIGEMQILLKRINESRMFFLRMRFDLFRIVLEQAHG